MTIIISRFQILPVSTDINLQSLSGNGTISKAPRDYARLYRVELIHSAGACDVPGEVRELLFYPAPE